MTLSDYTLLPSEQKAAFAKEVATRYAYPEKIIAYNLEHLAAKGYDNLNKYERRMADIILNGYVIL